MSKTSDTLFLIGPMGAGKSTIGRRLARNLKREFLDSDKIIEQKTGADIPLIFDLEGEAGFRKRESAVIDELTRQHNIVLATGGGAILSAENRKHLHDRGFVIYLYASVRQQLNRTAHDQNRPLLQTEDPRRRLEELFAVRDPLYRETAHLVVDTDGKTVPQVVRKIMDILGTQ
jgi:shikimate kinase